VCLSNQNQIAIGATVYSANNSFRWPERKILKAQYAPPFIIQNAGHDDRPALKEYMDLRNQCPFFSKSTEGIYEDIGNAGGYVYQPYSLYFGWRLNTAEKKMTFVHQNMTQDGDEFDIIVGGKNLTYRVAGKQSSHPDNSPSLMIKYSTVFANWQRGTFNTSRGKVDMNFIRKDCSGFMVHSVASEDERLEKVSYKQSYISTSNHWSLLPSTDYSN
jgi:hypothetical protein